MENIFLRAKRNFDDTPNYSAPEYADNRLDVTVCIPQGAADVKEMSIRIYSAERRFMGTGCITRNPRKLLKRHASAYPTMMPGKRERIISTYM